MLLVGGGARFLLDYVNLIVLCVDFFSSQELFMASPCDRARLRACGIRGRNDFAVMTILRIFRARFKSS